MAVRTYDVDVTVTRQMRVRVRAKNKDEAEQKAKVDGGGWVSVAHLSETVDVHSVTDLSPKRDRSKAKGVRKAG